MILCIVGIYEFYYHFQSTYKILGEYLLISSLTDIRLWERLFNREACQAVWRVLSKSSLVNLISKDTNLVFCLSVSNLDHSLEVGEVVPESTRPSKLVRGSTHPGQVALVKSPRSTPPVPISFCNKSCTLLSVMGNIHFFFRFCNTPLGGLGTCFSCPLIL